MHTHRSAVKEATLESVEQRRAKAHRKDANLTRGCETLDTQFFCVDKVARQDLNSWWSRRLELQMTLNKRLFPGTHLP